MSFGEELYLLMIVTLFAAFLVLIGSLAWLDAREEKIKRWQTRKAALATQRTRAAADATGQPEAAFPSG